MFTNVSDLTPVARLSRDIRKAAITLSDREARYLVDLYYQMQDNRIRSDGQVRSMVQGETGEPHTVLDWAGKQALTLENQIKSALDAYSMSTPIGAWSRSICGIGPVIASGLMAHINILRGTKRDGCDCATGREREYLQKSRKLNGDAPVCAGHPVETVGHIWRFAGLDPTANWDKGQRRPWNASLKVICWKAGESFVKVQANESDVYGKVFAARKQLEIERNERGDNEAVALERAQKVGKSTDAYKAYSAGKLPPAHIHARARRYAVKLFLAHWFEKAYRYEFNKAPPAPYPIAILGHAHKIEPPA